MKKIVPVFLVLILFVMVVPAYAESPEDLPIPTMPQTVAASGETPSDVSVDIFGTVQASVISAEVTLASAFVINPNDIPENRFISPDLSIKNTSNFPVQVMFVSLTKTGEASSRMAALMATICPYIRRRSEARRRISINPPAESGERIPISVQPCR